MSGFPPTAYTVTTEPVTGFWLEKPGQWKAFRGVVVRRRSRDNDAEALMERGARLVANGLRRRYQAELDATGKRPEVKRRELYEAKQQRHEESKLRRRALMADRFDMLRLLTAIAIEDNALILGALQRKAKEMADKHAQALADFEADPENKNGGWPDGRS